jgi:general secretion pathway protein M
VSLETTSPAVSQPLQRLLAVGLLIAALSLIVLGIVLPTMSRYAALESGIADNELALRRFEEVTKRLPRLEAERKTLQQALAAQDGFLKAPNDSLAAAELQARIKSAVEKSGGELKSIQTLPARDEKGFRRITARVEVMGNDSTLMRIWYDMESGVPFLFIDNFDIEARSVVRRDRTQPPLIALDVRFELAAYARGNAP